MAWGEYPAEYNPKVHGPYDPARYYGKGKIRDFLYLLGRLNKNRKDHANLTSGLCSLSFLY